MKSISRIILIVITVAGLAAAGGILARRMAFEKAQKNVEIVIDLNDARRLAPIEKDGLAAALEQFRSAGATTIGVYEDNLGNLAEDGHVTIISGRVEKEESDRLGIPGDAPVDSGLVAAAEYERIEKRFKDYMTAYFGPRACGYGRACILPLVRRDIDEMTIGFDAPPKTSMAVSLRPYNNFTETPQSIRLKFRQWDALEKKGPIIFDGSAVLGHARLIGEVAKQIKARPGISVGFVEMVQQDSLQALISKVPGHVVGVHSITQKEMSTMKEPVAVARIARAVRERKIQVVYLRLFNRDNGLAPADALKMNVEYVKKVSAAVRAAGKQPGLAAPMEDFKMSKWLRAVVVAGGAALLFLLADFAFGIPAALGVFVAVLAFIGCPASAAVGREMLYIKLAALGIGAFVPGLAAAALFLAPYKNYDGPGAYMPVVKNIAAWLACCALTFAAGVMIASMLAQREFFLRVDIFTGVKITLLMPFLIVGYSFVRTSGMSMREFFDSPVRYLEAAAAGLLLAAVAVMLIRSGNQSVGGSSGGGVELEMRNWLEAVLVIRPRTKEFLVGHPAMLLIGVVPFIKKNYAYAAVLLIGVIGQAGMLNTFCHLHTPFGITAARVVIGMLLGMIIGLCFRILVTAAGRFFGFGVKA